MKINLLCYHCGSVLIRDAPAKEIEKIESEFLKAHSQCYPAQLKSSTKREKERFPYSAKTLTKRYQSGNGIPHNGATIKGYKLTGRKSTEDTIFLIIDPCIK